MPKNFNIEEFIFDKYHLEPNETHRYTVKRYQCEKLIANIVTYDDATVYTSSQLINIFDGIDIITISTFCAYRRTAADILDYLGYNRATIDNLMQMKYKDVKATEMYFAEYFKDIGEMYSVLASIYAIDRDIDLTRAKVITGLIWYGFSTMAIAEIQLADINQSEQSICIPKKSRVIPIGDDRVFDSITSYLNRTGLSQSDYLFRTERSSKIDQSRISKWLNELNSYAGQTGKVFKTKNIMFSGSFDIAIKVLQSYGVVTIPSQYYFSNLTASDWKIKFAEWKGEYYPE